MNPEINIKISFGNVEGQVVVEKQSTDKKQVVDSGGEMKAPSIVDRDQKVEDLVPEIPTASSDSNGVLAVPEFDADADETRNDFSVPAAEEGQTDFSEIASVPSDEEEVTIAAPLAEDIASEMSAPEALKEEFVDFEANIPPIPEQDFSDAVEMQILAQLDDLDTVLEPESLQLNVPNGFQVGDLSMEDENIPPIPEV